MNRPARRAAGRVIGQRRDDTGVGEAMLLAEGWRERQRRLAPAGTDGVQTHAECLEKGRRLEDRRDAAEAFVIGLVGHRFSSWLAPVCRTDRS